MARPIDYGEKFPSDSGDVTPGDKTAGFTPSFIVDTRDYDTSLQELPLFQSDLGAVEDQDFNTAPREAWLGTINDNSPSSSDTTPDGSATSDSDGNPVAASWQQDPSDIGSGDMYTVVLQDGTTVVASCLAISKDEHYEAGQPCIVVRGNAPNEYFLLAQRMYIDSPSAIAFELYDDMTPGQTDKYAYLLKKQDLSRDTSVDKIKVSDEVNKDTNAHGSQTTGGAGARGWFIPINGKNQIVRCQQLAEKFNGTTTGTVAKTDTSFTVNTVTPSGRGMNIVTGNDVTVTVKNWAKWESNSGTKCKFIPDGAGGYDFLQGPCKGDT